MSPRRSTPNRGIAASLVVALGAGACVNAPTTKHAPIEIRTESGLDPTALNVRAESQQRTIRQATLRVRQRTCFGVGSGSGFAITDRVLVTNRHVVEGADALQVSMWDGRTFDVEISGIAMADDLALVLVSGSLPTTLAMHEPPDPGDEVTAVGYPLGGELSFSPGRVIDHVDGRLFGQQARSIRVSNKIQPGNSGGPLIDTEGRVVGVVYAIELATGHGLAVPIDALQRTVASATIFANPSPC